MGIIRKEVTSELEKRFSDQINEIKHKLLQTKVDDHSPYIHDTIKSTPNYTENQQYTFSEDAHNINNNDIEDDIIPHVEEEKNNINIKDEEGNGTKAFMEQLNAEEIEDHHHGNINDISNRIQSQNVVSNVLNVQNNDNISSSVDVNIFNKTNVSIQTLSDDEVEDTSKIEQAVGLIEMNHNQSSEIPDNAEHHEQKEPMLPKQKEATPSMQQKEHLSPKQAIHAIQPQSTMSDEQPLKISVTSEHTEQKKHSSKQPSHAIQPHSKPVIQSQLESEQAVEVNKINKKQSLKISVITEKNEQKEPILPKQGKSASSLVTQTNPEQIKKSKPKTNLKPKARTNPKIKRKFRAKTSRNRLQFSVLSMSSPNKSDNDDSYQPTNITKTQQTKKQNAPKLQLTN